MKSEPKVCHHSDTPDHTEPERSSGVISMFVVLLCLLFTHVLLTFLKMCFLFFLLFPPFHLQVVYSHKKRTLPPTHGLTVGGRRDTGESRTDTDTHSNQPSAASLLQLCSCSLQLASEHQRRVRGDLCSCQGPRLGCGNAKALLGLD